MEQAVDISLGESQMPQIAKAEGTLVEAKAADIRSDEVMCSVHNEQLALRGPRPVVLQTMKGKPPCWRLDQSPNSPQAGGFP